MYQDKMVLWVSSTKVFYPIDTFPNQNQNRKQKELPQPHSGSNSLLTQSMKLSKQPLTYEYRHCLGNLSTYV